MAAKRPSKDKRAARNRAQRAALAARAANAHAASASGGNRGSSASSGGGFFSRRRGGATATRAAASSGTRPSARARGAALRPDQPPGYRAALSAVLAAGAAVLICMFLLPTPVDGQGDPYSSETRAADFALTALRAASDSPDADPAEVVAGIEDWAPDGREIPVFRALWPFSLTLLLPLVAAGFAFQAVRKRLSSKSVNRALYAGLFGAVLTGGLVLLFLPVVLAMGVAMFQVRKAEAIAAASGESGVIDVEGEETADDEPEDDEGAPAELEAGEDALGDEGDVGSVDDVIEVDEVIDLDEPATGDDTDDPDGGERQP